MVGGVSCPGLTTSCHFLGLSREQGNILYGDYIWMTSPYSPLTPSSWVGEVPCNSRGCKGSHPLNYGSLYLDPY